MAAYMEVAMNLGNPVGRFTREPEIELWLDTTPDKDHWFWHEFRWATLQSGLILILSLTLFLFQQKSA